MKLKRLQLSIAEYQVHTVFHTGRKLNMVLRLNNYYCYYCCFCWHFICLTLAHTSLCNWTTEYAADIDRLNMLCLFNWNFCTLNIESKLSVCTTWKTDRNLVHELTIRQEYRMLRHFDAKNLPKQDTSLWSIAFPVSVLVCTCVPSTS